MRVLLLHTTYKLTHTNSPGQVTKPEASCDLCELKKCTYEYRSQVSIDSLIIAIMMKELLLLVQLQA